MDHDQPVGQPGHAAEVAVAVEVFGIVDAVTGHRYELHGAVDAQRDGSLPDTADDQMVAEQRWASGKAEAGPQVEHSDDGAPHIDSAVDDCRRTGERDRRNHRVQLGHVGRRDAAAQTINLDEQHRETVVVSFRRSRAGLDLHVSFGRYRRRALAIGCRENPHPSESLLGQSESAYLGVL